MSTEDCDAKVYGARQSDFHIDGLHMDPDSERVLRELFHSRGKYNVVGYSNPRVDELRSTAAAGKPGRV